MSVSTTVLDVPSGAPARVPTPAATDPRLDRLALNQKTTDGWGLEDLVAGCVDAGIPAVGLWREPVQAYGVERAAALVRDAGLRVSSLCRGGFLTATDPAAAATALADNRRAIDEAATLGAPCLVMVVGGLPEGSRDLPGARRQVEEALAALAPYAAERGVQLALEPLHPLFCADRAVLSTLGQALDLAERFAPETVGVVVDAYHVWWDPELEAQVARAAGRIASYQVCDFVLPLADDPLLSRGMMGDGYVDFTALTRAVAAAGYDGDIEVEIFDRALWAADPRDVVDTVKRRYVELVVDPV
ncbi:sugar phosphate isomerase/epimerase family protein [Egicoccus sp. AB-alg6-2]|uniref:sugar phosphate isomerase/epimerase family protein n=1 Tax=Egicoccus sp. AB-alg6-2 TaxID=3242692 RepID=UPI00359D1C1E